ncbi:hypothetical protein ACFW1A_17055 [Kitasatospora sp. NPDC058965]|uniref:hypothetical protein n=1 Tax=Kitasatospora sp. NPDC058965 TaxID=3346682 RepID=UPI0036914C5C
MNPINSQRRQARYALDQLTDALDLPDLPDLPDLLDGYRVTHDGTLYIQLRPLLPAELLQLAEALRRPDR